MSNFKVGDRVLITKPKDVSKYAHVKWNPRIDKYDSTIDEIAWINESGTYGVMGAYDERWSFHEDWFTLVEEG